ncbi:UNVERIFIED_CONTAM: hypothetical protein HDU68_001264, partial [Siphonaria sp. JEL0065]
MTTSEFLTARSPSPFQRPLSISVRPLSFAIELVDDTRSWDLESKDGDKDKDKGRMNKD